MIAIALSLSAGPASAAATEPRLRPPPSPAASAATAGPTLRPPAVSPSRPPPALAPSETALDDRAARRLQTIECDLTHPDCPDDLPFCCSWFAGRPDRCFAVIQTTRICANPRISPPPPAPPVPPPAAPPPASPPPTPPTPPAPPAPPPSPPGNVPCGSNAAECGNNLRSAVANAAPGAVLELEDGTYGGGGTSPFSATLDIFGFAVRLTLRARTPGRAVLHGEGVRRVVSIAGANAISGATVTLEGLNVTGGFHVVRERPPLQPPTPRPSLPVPFASPPAAPRRTRCSV